MKPIKGTKNVTKSKVRQEPTSLFFIKNVEWDGYSEPLMSYIERLYRCCYNELEGISMKTSRWPVVQAVV